MRRFLLPLGFLVGLATSARADVAPPPPDACPYGSRPKTCHGGAHCAIIICESKADCPSGQECQEVQACFGTILCVGGRYWRPDAHYPLNPMMKSACPNSGICDDGQTCQTQKLCVSAGIGSTETTITTTNVTSQQTSLATSTATSTDTVQGTNTPGAKLGDSGCSCRMGDWASAKTLGPWLLAGVFGVAVTLLRRRRSPR